MKTKRLINHFLNASRIGSFLIALFIFLSILSFTLETEFNEAGLLQALSYAIAVIFLIEYILRIWTADLATPEEKHPKLRYIFSFYGLVDLLAFIPALILPHASGSVVLRSLRLLRLLQIMKFKPLARGLKRVFTAVHASRSEMTVSLIISVILIFFGAVAMYYLEGEKQPDAFGSIPRALWWSMATLTTVGYGDVFPVTPAGKVVASAMAIVGIAAVAMPAGILAAAFSRATAAQDITDERNG